MDSFQVYVDSTGAYRWRLATRNSRYLALSAERHPTSVAAREDAERFARDVAGCGLEIYSVGADGWRWRIRDASGTPVATSPASHRTRQVAESRARRAIGRAPAAATWWNGRAPVQ